VSGPLAGLRVVDCSRGTAGPRATSWLADYGAEVIWVEPTGGDPYRDQLAIEYSVFLRGKRSVTSDYLTGGSDRDALLQLLESADVLFCSGRAGILERLGLSFDYLHERFPALVVCIISAFGPGERFAHVPGYEAIVHAVVGTMGEQVGHREGPIFEGLPFASIGASYLALIGVLSVLYRRLSDGTGRLVETSMLDGALAYLAIFWGESDADANTRRNVAHGSHLPMGAQRLITGSFLCADGEYIGVHTGAVGAFGRLMTVLGLADRIPPSENGLDMGVPLTDDQKQLLDSEIHDIFLRYPREEWVRRLYEADVCGIPQLHPGEVFDQPQTRHNGMIVTVDDPALGLVEQVAPPLRFAKTPGAVRGAAPLPGETTIADLQANRPAVADGPWCGQAPLDMRPLLDGVRIVDLGAYFAGPYASRLLADLGADVIKLEPLAGDPYRGTKRQFTTPQSGKRSIAMNLKADLTHEARDRLIAWADVIHHNMRPQAAERLGIGYEQVRVIKPDIIYGHASGWGQSGPSSAWQSFEPMMSGFVGVGHEVAGQHNPPLYPAGHADPANGLMGAVGILMALVHRRRTGEGQFFENPQLNATMAQLSHLVRDRHGAVLGAGKLDPLQYGRSALERLYETNDGWVCIVAATDGHVMGLGRCLGLDLACDPRFHTQHARQEHDYELTMLIDAAIRQRGSLELIAELTAAGVPCAQPRSHNNHAFVTDPENRATGRVVERAYADFGAVRDLALLLRVSDAHPASRRLAPRVGEHTREILDELGLAATEVDTLFTAGVVR
jgi:crotonobetainyl-CoA:carnitine CoA-transferase CaiB-like acyl-CoA transferase